MFKYNLLSRHAYIYNIYYVYILIKTIKKILYYLCQVIFYCSKMDSNNELFVIVNMFVDLMENKQKTMKDMTMDNMKKMFNACLYVEKLIKRIENGKQEVKFEQTLSAMRKKDKKYAEYKCSNLKNSSDNFLEMCLKDKTMETDIIDEL